MRLSTPILLVGLALLGVFAWAYNKSKQPGSSGGVFSQIGGAIGGVMGITQNVTENSKQTFETIGSFGKDAAYGIGGTVKAGAGGVIGLVDSAAHVGGSVNPANWDWPW
jgi:hypothetical protein